MREIRQISGGSPASREQSALCDESGADADDESRICFVPARIVVMGTNHLELAGIRAMISGLSEKALVVGYFLKRHCPLPSIVRLRPDTIIWCLAPLTLEHLAAMNQLHSQLPGTALLCVVSDMSPRAIPLLFRAGCLACVLADDAQDDLAQALRAARCGHRWVSPGLANILYASLDGSAVMRTMSRLDPMELHLARLLAQGLRNRDMALALHLSVKTVEHRLTVLYSKLDVRSRGAAIATLMRTGLLLTDQ